MDIRERILAAAQAIYAKHGFRGATTRLIAIEAGVNEVTLFRTFGSKAALFDALIRDHVGRVPIPALQDEPADPERELIDWCAGLLGYLRENRSLLRTAFGEIEERPDSAASMCQGPRCAGMALTQYVTRLQQDRIASKSADVQTAVAMLMSTIIGDAIRRDVMPHAFPPEDEAPVRYVRIFMRAIGVERLRRVRSSVRSAAGD